MPEVAYVNGRFCPPSEAMISIEDRGFQFADGVYEVVVAHAGRVFRLEQHLQRLRRSLELIDFSHDLAALDLPGAIQRGLEQSAFDPAMVYIQITRGVQPRSHLYSTEIKPTVVMTFKAKPEVAPSKREQGVAVVTVSDDRWLHCEIKSIALLANILAKNRAVRAGFEDAIFIGSADLVREGTSSNVFVIRDGVLMTPEADASILHGVTRIYVCECAQKLGVAVRECVISTRDLESADEVFLSSTVLDILPVTRVNESVIGSGLPGQLTRNLYRTFLDGLSEESRYAPSIR